MAKILLEADEAPVARVAKKQGVSDVTIFAWRAHLGKLYEDKCEAFAADTHG